MPNGRYDEETGRVVFTTTHFSGYAVGYRKVSFRDVSADAWYGQPPQTGSGRGPEDFSDAGQAASWPAEAHDPADGARTHLRQRRGPEAHGHHHPRGDGPGALQSDETVSSGKAKKRTAEHLLRGTLFGAGGAGYSSMFVMLCRLIPRVERLCSSAETVGGRTPTAPSAIRAELKPMTVR